MLMLLLPQRVAQRLVKSRRWSTSQKRYCAGPIPALVKIRRWSNPGTGQSCWSKLGVKVGRGGSCLGVTPPLRPAPRSVLRSCGGAVCVERGERGLSLRVQALVQLINLLLDAPFGHSREVSQTQPVVVDLAEEISDGIILLAHALLVQCLLAMGGLCYAVKSFWGLLTLGVRELRLPAHARYIRFLFAEREGEPGGEEAREWLFARRGALLDGVQRKRLLVLDLAGLDEVALEVVDADLPWPPMKLLGERREVRADLVTCEGPG
mmetsp:Transcript_27514/g.64910  ORF Transcript_27514/g.64910 Transcript_27514/m.64910 type:complete len:265 (-) Transcript_27514:87-881(-)